MVDEVLGTGATRATVLLPSSSFGSFEGQAAAPRPGGSKLVFGYAGTVQTSGHLEMFRRFAALAVARGHTLRIFSPHPEAFWRTGLGDSFQDGMWGGSLPGEAVPAALREQTDALFLPLSFEPRDRDNMRVSFPCKVCDYCASGRPIVAWLPPYSSAAQWMAAQNGAFLLNTSADDGPMAGFIERLESPAARLSLGQAAFSVGRAAFSSEAAAAAFRAAVARH
jgi:hypothetical protein